jgi:hypothetical protein
VARFESKGAVAVKRLLIALTALTVVGTFSLPAGADPNPNPESGYTSKYGGVVAELRGV